jgi:ABC-type transport system involved in cytochrome c biogenesis permease subunit
MEAVARALSILVPILYALTVMDYFLFFYGEDPRARRIAGAALAVTLSAHILYAVTFSWAHGHFPLADVFEAMTTLSLAITLVYVYVELSTRAKTTGPFILLLAFVFQLISSVFIVPGSEISSMLSDPLLLFHTNLIMLGFAGLAVAFVYGLLYLMLYHEIKSHRLGIIYRRLPALEKLFEMCRAALYFGFIFLTVGLVLGIFSSARIFPGRWISDPKFVLGILTWAIYGACIVTMKLGWESKRIVYFSLIGFAVTLFSFLALNLFLPSFHDFM